jgi:hypothetical protein
MRSLVKVITTIFSGYATSFFLFYFLAGLQKRTGLHVLKGLRIIYAMVPIIGTLFFGWSALSIIFMMWFEAIVFGVFLSLRFFTGLFCSRLMRQKFFSVLFAMIGYWWTFMAGSLFTFGIAALLAKDQAGDIDMKKFEDSFMFSLWAAGVIFCIEAIVFVIDFTRNAKLRTLQPNDPLLDPENAKVVKLIGVPITAILLMMPFGGEHIDSRVANCFFVFALWTVGAMIEKDAGKKNSGPA